MLIIFDNQNINNTIIPLYIHNLSFKTILLIVLDNQNINNTIILI